MKKKLQNWSNEELDFLQENYSLMTVKQLSEKLNRNVNSVYYAIREFGLKKQQHSPWTDAENEYLTAHCMELSADLAKYLNRTVASVNTQKDRLGLSKNQPWTDEDVLYIQEHYQTDLYSDISIKLNRTESAIRAKCHDLGLVQKDEWTDDDVEFLSQNYYEIPNKDLAQILNRTENAIHIKANKLGLKKSPYYCDYNFFDNIDTEEKAYWLGFLTADGWINKNEKSNAGVVGTEIQYGDIEHLKKFNKSLKGNYKISDRWRECSLSNNKDKKHMCCLRIFSLTMYNSLTKIGFTNTKSYDADIPNIAPNLMSHFIRGYFDGDGCFTYTNKSFSVSFVSASNNLIKSLKRFFNDVLDINCNITSYIDEFGTTIYRIYIGSMHNKINLLDYMYSSCNIYLDRKYQKYLRIKTKLKTSSLAC